MHSELFQKFQIKSPIEMPAEQTQQLSIQSKTSITTCAHSNNTTHDDYPYLEYPPTFEPQTYSLSDPNTSLTLLRRRNNNQSK